MLTLILWALVMLAIPLRSSSGHANSNHMCKLIAEDRLWELHIKGMFYVENYKALIIIESDLVYKIPIENRVLHSVDIPMEAEGDWRSNSYFWNTEMLNDEKVMMITQFELSHDIVALYFTERELLYYAIKGENKIERVRENPIRPGIIFSNYKTEGYFLTKYKDDGQIGMKDLYMSFQMSSDQKEQINAHNFHYFFPQLSFPTEERYTVDAARNDTIRLYPHEHFYASTFKSLPFGFMIDSVVYLVDVLDDKVHVFKFKPLVDLNQDHQKYYSVAKRTYRFRDFFKCPGFEGGGEGVQQSKYEGMYIIGFGAIVLLVVVALMVIMTVSLRRKNKKPRFSNEKLRRKMSRAASRFRTTRSSNTSKILGRASSSQH